MTRAVTHEAHLYSWPPTREVARVLTMDLTEDTGWMPRWSAVVTCITTPELLNSPPEYLTLAMRRMDAQAVPLSAWTKAWGGRVRAMTAGGAIGPRAITQKLGGDTTAAEPVSLTVTLMARDYAHDLKRGTTTINLTGCEMALADRLLLDEPKYMIIDSNTMERERIDPAFAKGSKTSEMVNGILSWLGLQVAEYPATDYTLRDDHVWTIGTAADSILSAALSDRDMLMWAERPDRYILSNRITGGSILPVNPSTGLVSAEYVNDLGAANARGGIKLVESPSKSHVEVRYYGNAPGLMVGHFDTVVSKNAAPGLPPGTYPVKSPNKTRTGSRSHVFRVETVSDYQYRADRRARVTIPGKIDRTGTIRSVTYQYPGGLAELDIESASPAT